MEERNKPIDLTEVVNNHMDDLTQSLALVPILAEAYGLRPKTVLGVLLATRLFATLSKGEDETSHRQDLLRLAVWKLSGRSSNGPEHCAKQNMNILHISRDSLRSLFNHLMQESRQVGSVVRTYNTILGASSAQTPLHDMIRFSTLVNDNAGVADYAVYARRLMRVVLCQNSSERDQLLRAYHFKSIEDVYAELMEYGMSKKEIDALDKFISNSDNLDASVADHQKPTTAISCEEHARRLAQGTAVAESRWQQFIKTKQDKPISDADKVALLDLYRKYGLLYDRLRRFGQNEATGDLHQIHENIFEIFRSKLFLEHYTQECYLLSLLVNHTRIMPPSKKTYYNRHFLSFHGVLRRMGVATQSQTARVPRLEELATSIKDFFTEKQIPFIVVRDKSGREQYYIPQPVGQVLFPTETT